ncbi:Molybdenum cofactor synthesis protein 3, partial [Blyttiomyces sp. JEL0837]
QLSLRNSGILIVGAGGLGSPAALYLAAAGIGRLGIVDYDDIENSNLQRQIIHDEDKVGRPKAESAKESVERMTSFVKCTAYKVLLDSTNAKEIISSYDLVLDATDNVATRYLLNDACVLLKKPLVSGSALRMEGQLTVYNLDGGPCYRCIFPKPPPPETVTNCSDGGVLGVASYRQKLLLFDSVSGAFRSVKLRGRNPSCAACGDTPTISELIDYVQFCGASATDKTANITVLKSEERISCEKFANEIINVKTPHILLDVREEPQFDICSLPGSVNIPWRQLPRRLGEVLDASCGNEDVGEDGVRPQKLPVYVVCRLGNDSQLAVRLLKASGVERAWDVEGGLTEWAKKVDPTFPTY